MWAQLYTSPADRQKDTDRSGLYAGWKAYCAAKLCRVWRRLLPTLTWSDSSVRARAPTLLHINWGQWSQHAQHLKEETDCWKQASHLDFLHPYIELWPLLGLLPGSQTPSSRLFPNKQAPGTGRQRPTDFGKLEIPSFKEQTCKSREV